MRWNEFSLLMDDLATYAYDVGCTGCSEAVAVGKDIRDYILTVKQEQRRDFFCLEHPEQELSSSGECSRCVASDLLD